MSASPSGVSSYASQVAARLKGLPSDQQREVEVDVRQRLVDMGLTSWDDAVARLGTPAAYAEEMREAAGWPRSRRRRWPWVVVVAVALGAVGWLVVQKATAVPKDYPLVFASWVQSGEGSSAGSVIVMPDRVDAPILIAIELVNGGDRTVRIDGLQRFVGASTQGDLVVMGSDADPPLWTPKATMTPAVDGGGISFNATADPSGVDLAGFSLAPGEHALLQLSGAVQYCVEAAQGMSIGDHIRLDTTIEGERRVITGTELSFPLGNCS